MSNSGKNIIITLLAVAILGTASKRRIRKSDLWGSGSFGAPRGNRPHLGIDLIYSPDEKVRAPFKFKVDRVSYPYASPDFSGLAFTATSGDTVYDGRLWYFEPDINLIGKTVRKGQVIGTAQQINSKYSGMINHLHLQLVKINEQATEKDIIYNNKVFTNPSTVFVI